MLSGRTNNNCPRKVVISEQCNPYKLVNLFLNFALFQAIEEICQNLHWFHSKLFTKAKNWNRQKLTHLGVNTLIFLKCGSKGLHLDQIQ